ncbi:MAG: argininosuccinate synthase [Armatimonadota bacterium]|nr:argininosuccinate synthase [Armatimonadota bacterium]MDR7443157.1 argininosuccinate synthase [Armatimonadota bacterium]MDR7569572.1 argininosuccinate synthase [Armatimonadota bacterium]MDR7614626.1 argininosuccinate synthase [Armatimonadota bacterium]
MRKVALAYSGGLDTSVAIPWLRERYGCEVVAVVADVGQLDDFDALRQKALQSGASGFHVVDVREEFVRDYCFRALRAGAVYEGRYLLGTALARPLIAKVQVEVARATGCDALAHGCTGKGNDQVRFELSYRALAPDLRVIAPWREWDLRSREDELRYAEEHGIPVPVTAEKPYSIDQNLWHTSYEGGILEDPSTPPPEEMFQLTVDPRRAPDVPQRLEIAFERGIPVAVDGVRMSPAELVRHLNRVAGAHGVGRVDMVENRLVGMKSRGVYETPAGTVLTVALRDLEAITLDRDTVRFKELVAARYADLVYSGLWYSPLREALDAFLESTHRYVTGTVTVELYKGHCWAVSRSSPYSLYRQDLATFGEGAAYDHRDATGFIRLWGLPLQVFAAVHPGSREAEAPAGQKP